MADLFPMTCLHTRRHLGGRESSILSHCTFGSLMEGHEDEHYSGTCICSLELSKWLCVWQSRRLFSNQQEPGIVSEVLYSLAFSARILRVKIWPKQPQPLQKPHCSLLNACPSLSATLIWITRQGDFHGRLSRAMPLQLSHTLKNPFLCLGIVRCSTQASGNSSSSHVIQARSTIYYCITFSFPNLSTYMHTHTHTHTHTHILYSEVSIIRIAYCQ